MALSTISAIKTALGISGSGEDTKLTQWLRAASYAVRAHAGRYLGGVISAITAANPAVVTSVGHGLEDGDTIFVYGSNSGVTINGSQAITFIDDDSFTVPVNNSGAAGTAGTFARTYTEYYNGTGTLTLCLRERPVLSVASIYEHNGGYWGQGDDAFAAANLLIEGTDYALDKRNDRDAPSESGIVYRLKAAWPGSSIRLGTLAAAPQAGLGNIKVTYTAGYPVLPYNVREAVNRLVAEMRLSADSGGPMQSETVDYYTYQRQTAQEMAGQLSSVVKLLAKYKEVLV